MRQRRMRMRRCGSYSFVSAAFSAVGYAVMHDLKRENSIIRQTVARIAQKIKQMKRLHTDNREKVVLEVSQQQDHILEYK